MEHCKEKDGRSKISGTGSFLLENDEKLKNPTVVVNVFNNYMVAVTRKVNIQQIEKEYATGSQSLKAR